MFSTTWQSSPLSLFCSTSSQPLSLFSTHVDPTLPADSFIHCLNDSTCEPRPQKPKTLLRLPDLSQGHHERAPRSHADEEELPNGEFLGRQLAQTVLHIQSPTLRTTFIRCPPLSSNPTQGDEELGLRLAYVHLQMRALGRPFSFEVGIVDYAGRRGTIRCSTFQVCPLHLMPPCGSVICQQAKPKLYATRHHPLLHLPLSFPTASSRPLTSWSTISLDLPSLLPFFSSLAPSTPRDGTSDDSRQAQVPAGKFSHISYMKVYANCRLKRIWLTDTKTTPSMALPWEFELYGS